MVPRQYAIGEAARMLGVSVDTLRRWDRQGRIETRRDSSNRRLVPAAEIERLRAGDTPQELSARNRFAGVVREVKLEGLLAQVELEAGPYRVVAVITREAAEQLRLAPGVPATALVKATSVMVER
ncbi:MAG TPA: helix-turn-helix transcriptional regulator [Gaiellaceae bacterium]|nr:helix-turn-helix transcriptional regulator [Gaiellaceae bacterium]